MPAKGLAVMIAAFLSIPAPVFAAQDAKWTVLKSDHFIVYSAEGGKAFAQEVLKKSETYYQQIAGWLGYPRRNDFWTWNNRCKIFIYKTKDDYLSKTGQSAWSAGAALLNKRTVVSFHEAPHFLESVLPHELAHLIFRDFMGEGNVQIPLWLDEGVAMAQEEMKRQEFDGWVRQMMLEKKWIQMKDFMQVQSLGNSSGPQAALFYAQAQSVVRFLVEDFGSVRFAGFCRSLRDAELPEEALRKNYPAVFTDLKSFETRWVDYASKGTV